MKTIIALLLLVFATTFTVNAQDAVATAEPPAGVIEKPLDETTVIYVEVMPAWVLPGFGVMVAVMAFLVSLIYRQGTHLKDMISEKAFTGLLRIVLDVARDITARTPTKLDDALIGLLTPEAPPVTNTINIAPSAEPVPGVG